MVALVKILLPMRRSLSQFRTSLKRRKSIRCRPWWKFAAKYTCVLRILKPSMKSALLKVSKLLPTHETQRLEIGRASCREREESGEVGGGDDGKKKEQRTEEETEE